MRDMKIHEEVRSLIGGASLWPGGRLRRPGDREQTARMKADLS